LATVDAIFLLPKRKCKYDFKVLGALGWAGGRVAEHAAVAGSPLHLDVAVVAPPVAPAVLDEPVVESAFTAVADDGDGVVVLVAVETFD
jgi:hypothetical protein